MKAIKFRFKELNEDWELIEYQMDNHSPQSFTRTKGTKTTIPTTIVNRINPRGGRQWKAKKLTNNKDWQGIILFNEKACYPE